MDTENTVEKIKNILSKVSAGDIMSRFAITVNEDSILSNAAHYMMRFRISGLPVLSQDGQVKGIITATDLFRIMGEIVNGSLDFICLSEECKRVMTKDIMIVEEETTLWEIINIMHNKNIHTLPVVKDGKISGIIGRRDVINTFYDPSRFLEEDS